MQHHTPQDIADALAQNAEVLGPLIIGEAPTSRHHNELRFGKKGGLRLFINGPKAGKWTDYRDDTYGNMIALIANRSSISYKEAITVAKQYLNIENINPKDIQATEPKDTKTAEDEKRERIAKALKNWNRAKPLTEKNIYLENRGIPTLEPAIPALRENTYYSKKYKTDITTLVFAATQDDGTLTATQSILTADGKKLPIDTPKHSNGVLRGAAVRFDTPQHYLTLAEGPETALSWRQITGEPTWCTLGLSNFTNITLPDHVTHITLLGDIDTKGHGLCGAARAFNYYQNKGYAVRILLPGSITDHTHYDFNNFLQDQGAEALREFHKNPLTFCAPQNPNTLIITRDGRAGFDLWNRIGGELRLVPDTEHTKDRSLLSCAYRYLEPHIDTIYCVEETPNTEQIEILPKTLSLYHQKPYCDKAPTNLKQCPVPIHNDDGQSPILLTETKEDGEWITGTYAIWDEEAESEAWSHFKDRNIILTLPQTERGFLAAYKAAKILRERGGIVWAGPRPPKRIPLKGEALPHHTSFSLQLACHHQWNPEALRVILIREATPVMWSNPHTENITQAAEAS